MTDNTEKIHVAGKPDSTQEQLRQLSRRVSELFDLLRGQRDALRQRGINLPTGSLETLRSIKQRIDVLARTLLNTQSELRQLRALAETTALVNSSLSTDEVLNQVMDTVIHLTGAERGYIVLKNHETGELEFTVARGMDQGQLNEKEELVVSKSIVNQVADTGEAVLTDNASQDARYEGHQSIVGFQLRSILAVPLKVKDRVIGVVYCDNRILAGLFKQHELDILTAFAHQAAVALENARLFNAVREQLDEVSELRARLDNIFTSIASGVITVDAQNVVVTCNAAAQHIMDAETAIGQSLYDILPAALHDPFVEFLQQVRSSGQQADMDIQPELGSRGPRYWKLLASPLRGADHVSEGVTIVLDDLTELKQRESQLAEVRRYLPMALVENIRGVEDLGIGGQEREITSFSCDVRGFTTFSEKLQPEVLMEIINKYLSLASDAINLYEGIVDKYMGDAVTGLFNTQLNPQEDHAVRAVQTGMQLMMDLRALHEVIPEDQRLFYGVGIHTGMAVLGNVGSEDRKEFAALGDAVDISKFMEGNAKAGQVVISGSTFERVKHVFDCEPVPVIRPKKGFEHVTDLYRVIRRKKGVVTGPLALDPELAELLNELKKDN